MRVLITGATGFIGKNLSERLIQRGYKTYALTRSGSRSFDEKIKYIRWDGKSIEGIQDKIDVIVNLAGENIFSLRWTESKKQRILQSRVNSGKALCEAIKRNIISPGIFIQASATGYYGDGDEIQNENFPQGKGFLSKVVKAWEDSTKEVEDYGVRRCVTRFGAVLGKGGMLSRIIPVFNFYAGGVIGDKEKWISWIHIEDLIKSIIFLIENKKSKGVYNLTSPNPVKNARFYKEIANLLKKPCWLNIPEFLLKLVMGEIAKEVLLRNQRIIPERLLKEGYKFIYPDLKEALKSIV